MLGVKIGRVAKNSSSKHQSAGAMLVFRDNIAMELPHFLIGNTSSFRVHFPANYVSLPECNFGQ